MQRGLAHLLLKTEAPAATCLTGTAGNGTAVLERFATLKDNLHFLTARLYDLQAVVEHKLDSRQDRPLRHIAALIDDRLVRR